jgi:hypothetical protein
VRIFFSILSIAYIAGIFLFAGSSIAQTLAPFNRYSLLHIPLYGILTFLLIVSFLPREMRPALWQHRYCSMGSLFHRGQLPNNLMPHRGIDASTHSHISTSTHSRIHAFTHPRIYASPHFLIPGFIALIVAIADEIHQAYVPGRDASATDVLLDLFGIILVLFFFFRLSKTKTNVFPH